MRFILRCTLFNEMFYLMKCFIFLSYDVLYLNLRLYLFKAFLNSKLYLKDFKRLYLKLYLFNSKLSLIQSFLFLPFPIFSKPLLSISFKF